MAGEEPILAVSARRSQWSFREQMAGSTLQSDFIGNQIERGILIGYNFSPKNRSTTDLDQSVNSV